jgi:H+/Cl- antiporter ClcA
MMRRRILQEQSVMFISVIKWFFLASVIGAVVGVSTTLFLKGLDLAIEYASKIGSHYFLLLPLAMLVSTLLVKYLAPDAEGHGTEKIIEAVHEKQANINILVVPVKLAATIVTIAFGGSVGKEGPCAQIGAGLASTIANALKFDAADRRKLVICGISAGFATVFGTPLAGAIFGVEVLVVGSILYDVLLPSFVAGIVGYHISANLGIDYFTLPIPSVPEFSLVFFLQLCMAGIFFGLISFLLIELLKYTDVLGKKMQFPKPLKAIMGGSLIAVLAMFFGNRYLGLGLDTIESSLAGEHVPASAFALKSLFTALTLSFGGSGGIVTPIFFIGSTSGSLFGSVMGLDPQIFAAIGMVALLAGGANTPISASIMAAELFGSELASYAAIACVISFLITGHRSVYPSQVLAVAKSPSIKVSEGLTMEQIVNVEISTRKKGLTGSLLSGISFARRTLSRRDRARHKK